MSHNPQVEVMSHLDWIKELRESIHSLHIRWTGNTTNATSSGTAATDPLHQFRFVEEEVKLDSLRDIQHKTMQMAVSIDFHLHLDCLISEIE